MMHSLTHPVLCAVGVQLQCVQALRRAGNLSFDFSTQQAVRHKRTFTYSQDLRRSRGGGRRSRGRGRRLTLTHCLWAELGWVGGAYHVLVEGGLSLAAA